jgi:hypothetical protein
LRGARGNARCWSSPARPARRAAHTVYPDEAHALENIISDPLVPDVPEGAGLPSCNNAVASFKEPGAAAISAKIAVQKRKPLSVWIPASCMQTARRFRPEAPVVANTAIEIAG